MEKQIIILDANIVVKILHEEGDSKAAKDFLSACTQNNTQVLVPEHFLYELISVCQKLDIEVFDVLKFFRAMKDSIVTVVMPDDRTWLLAEKISKEGHEKSGFPSMYDSIYHALAIVHKGVFVTADQTHFAKTKTISHISLLRDWVDIF
ncbi:MAG: type II toxin-antitoxin system VapC family toxin [Candidatus Puniceispirillales bacterium WSBS_2018_MAG_OTU23]